MRRVLFPLLYLLVLGLPTRADTPQKEASCPITPLTRDTAPHDPNAMPVGPTDWYINGDRTIWAGAVPMGGWLAGGVLYSGKGQVKGQKTYWVQPKGTQLAITGHRLDGNALPVEAHVPCCYPTGFQIVGLYFPTEGCWQVNAKAGPSELQFVTRVRPAALKER